MGIHPIFDRCHAEAPTRYDIDKVFIKSGFRCATDGRILVREKCGEPDTEGKTPDSVMNLGWDDCVPEPTPLSAFEDVTCKVCDGQSECECSTCHGTGDHECDCGGDAHECGACDGHGKFTCGGCHMGKHKRLKTGDSILGLGGRYMAMLAEYGAVIHLRKPGMAPGPVRFVIEGGIEGMLMPRTDIE